MPYQWIEELGVHDGVTGATAAREARKQVLEPAKRVLESSDEITVRLLVFQGFVAKAQALHDSATEMIAAENPHAAFTLIRAYAENAAAILFAKDNPGRVKDFVDTERHGIPVGRITNHAAKRFGSFKEIYDQLSQFAHPQALGLVAPTSVQGDRLSWSSVPQFKQPDDQLLAYAWVIELAQATRHLLYEFAQRYHLGYFACAAPPDA